ncbi:glycosyltransferase [Vibrio splendidus]
MVLLIQNSIKTTRLFRYDYLKLLTCNGFKVSVLAIDDCQISKDCLESLGVNLILISGETSFFKRFFLFNKLIIKLLMSGKVRHIQCHFLATILVCYPSLLMASKKTTLFIEGLGTVFLRSKALRRVFRFLFTAPSFKRVFMNKFERSELGIESDLVLGGIGVCDKFFDTKRRYVCSSKLKIGYFGRLVIDKGVNDCLFIADKLIKEKVDFVFSFYGDIYPQNPTSLTRKDIDSAESKYAGVVNFHGFTEDVISSMDNVDIVVLPSRCEGFPVIVMEANSLGKPVFVYDVPGCRDAVCDGVNGFVIRGINPGKMTESIISYSKLSDIEKNNLYSQSIEYASINFRRVDKNKAILQAILR